MASPKPVSSPLRDRLMSNSPDPIKSSILRESGLGWTSPPSGTPEKESSRSPLTSPLRVAKRDTPKRSPGSGIARRTSSSYRHMRSNNLVSKSPFKSQIPTPSSSSSGPSRPPLPFSMSPTRRVSGEKRPRPISMDNLSEAENERPFAYKRERRQSKTFQGLLEREPVTKSPFKLPSRSTQQPPPSVPRVPVPTPTRIPAATLSSTDSPARSSLVSKRLHGPRHSGSGKRERRKTVTWDDRMEVMEISDEEQYSDEAMDEEDMYEEEADPDPFFQAGPISHTMDSTPDSSFDSVDLSAHGSPELDGDQSLAGIVEEMLGDVSSPHTPPHNDSLPPDLETEDGVPLGRSHHADRIQEQRRRSSQGSVNQHVFAAAVAAHGTPDRTSTPSHEENSVPASPPLGRTTHLERLQVVREAEAEITKAIENLPESPSLQIGSRDAREEVSLPESLPSAISSDQVSAPEHDPSTMPLLQDEPFPAQRLDMSGFSLPQEPEELERSASFFDASREFDSEGPSLADEKQPATSPIERPASTSRNLDSPVAGSPASPRGSINGSPAGRPRINREDVHRRLLHRRSFGSPTPEHSPGPESRGSLSRTNSPMSSLSARSEGPGNDKDAASVLTGATDMSTETATVQVAEKWDIEEEFGVIRAPETASRLKFDFGSKFGLGGLGFDNMDVEASDVMPERRPRSTGHSDTTSTMSTTASAATSSTRIEVGPVDVDMEMRSALDKLMDDVAGESGGAIDVSMTTSATDDGDEDEDGLQAHLMERAATHSTLDVEEISTHIISRTVSTSSAAPPIPPPKDNIRSREAMIIEKRREARRVEEESGGFNARSKYLGVGQGRPSRRRSRSTGDADCLTEQGRKTSQSSGKALLDIQPQEDDPLLNTIEKELLKRDTPAKKKYLVREHEETIYASSDYAHMAGPGDVNTGRAWRTVRRPSDMNEYAKQIREYRSQENPSKAYGKVFVRVLGIKGINVPMPHEPTIVTCTLNNGIHFVTTPDTRFGPTTKIDQEFELIEHSKLELTLTLKIRRDPHIISQYKALAPPVIPIAAPIPQPMIHHHQNSSRTNMLSFFSSSPKKSKSKDKDKERRPETPPIIAAPPQHKMPDNLARYLKPDGTLARAFIAFRDVAARCDTRLFETSYPLIGQRLEVGNKFSTAQIGEITIQLFRLPPLPGVPTDQLPQSLDECHRGLRHVNWHKVTYFEGTLTQSGGDCSSWRRRHFRVIGANLVAFNDVTKRATATIDLKKAISVEDDQARNNAMSPASQTTSRFDDDGLFGVERSFRLIFPNDVIVFFADTDGEKTQWLEVLNALVGHIPPNPLWAELLWQRNEDATKRARAASTSRPAFRS